MELSAFIQYIMANKDWWGFLMDQREKQHLFYFHAILMYAGVRGGCIHPESDLLASYDLASFVRSYEEDLVRAWPRQEFIHGRLTGYHHFVHAAISLARKYFGDKWPATIMFQDYQVVGVRKENTWLHHGVPEIMAWLLHNE